jgi:hypothetical protein
MAWFQGTYFDWSGGQGWEFGWFQWGGGWSRSWYIDPNQQGWAWGWTWNSSTGWEHGWYFNSGWEWGWHTVGSWFLGWYFDHSPWAFGWVHL